MEFGEWEGFGIEIDDDKQVAFLKNEIVREINKSVAAQRPQVVSETKGKWQKDTEQTKVRETSRNYL